MKKFDWIKMGLRIVKVIILTFLIILINTTVSNKVYIKSENFNFNVNLGMTATAKKDKEEKPVPVEPVQVSDVLASYSGDLTGYSADCPLCNGTLACKRSYNVYKNNVVTYNDSKYGNVRIVASSKKLACGSIIRFNLKSISSEPVYAIVLDRGVLNRNIDLLMPTESSARKLVGRKKISYEVLRFGW